MDTRSKRVLTAAIAGLALAFGWVLLTLPPRPQVVDLSDSTTDPGLTVAGAFHVHTTRSDGGGSVDDVARAADQAGLQFLIITDHGNGTRPPDPPQYRSGVLTLDGVEISTNDGHYIAVGLPATPYPLGGEADTVVEDVRRLGGFGVVAHPTSQKLDLSWRDSELDVDGVEWLNADSEWRDESRPTLLSSVLRYPFRPSETLGSLLDRPDDALALWDRASERRHVVGLAGHDAHGRVSTGTPEEGNVSLGLGFPDYAELFQTFSLRVHLERSLSGDAVDDAEMLLGALRAGRVFTVIDAVASPAAFRYEAVGAAGSYAMGERIPANTPVELRASATAPPGSEIVLLADGRSVQTVPAGQELRYPVQTPAAYRVEVRVNSATGEPSVPWIVGNPIVVGAQPAVSRPASRSPVEMRSLMGRRRDEGGIWDVEHDVNSTADLRIDSGAMVFRYQLASAESESPFAAAMRPVDGTRLEGFDGIAFDVVADRPVRLFVQLRAGSTAGAPRWRSSFYADTTPRRVTVAFDELDAVQPNRSETLDLAQTDALLMVAELVNALPGSVAEISVRRLRLERWSGRVSDVRSVR